MKEYDLIVLGGGLVGLMFTHLLCQETTLRVAVIDKHPPVLEWPNEGYDLRTSAISPGSQHLFAKLGLWSALSDLGVGHYRRMEVWDGMHFGHIEFDAHDIACQELGYIVENRAMVVQLYTSLNKMPQVDFFFGEAQSLDIDKCKVALRFKDNQPAMLCAGLVVGADGGNSWLRQQMKVPVNVWSYQQRAIVTNVETNLAHENVARQRFLPEGPLAFLPLMHPHHVAVVWSNDETQAEALLALSPETFAMRLSQEMEMRYGVVKLLNQRAAFPLRRIHSDHYISNRCVLLGDAAHVIHPLAGQGVNLGFADAQSLAGVLQHAYQANQDLGAHLVLRRYERARKGQNLLTQRMMDLFYSLFGSTHAWVENIRGVGLEAVNQAHSLKLALMRQACGIKA